MGSQPDGGAVLPPLRRSHRCADEGWQGGAYQCQCHYILDIKKKPATLGRGITTGVAGHQLFNAAALIAHRQKQRLLLQVTINALE
jgi:hypothetical protein